MPVQQSNSLRRRLAGLPAEMRVIPNRMCRRIVGELEWGMDAAVLRGPTAMISGKGDVVEAAKLLKKFIEEQRLPLVKAGRMDGRNFSATDFEELVNIPGRPALYAMLVGALAAPGTALVGALNQKLLSLLYVLKAVQDKKSQAQ